MQHSHKLKKYNFQTDKFDKLTDIFQPLLGKNSLNYFCISS
jgi:hypothetical protein